MRRKTGRRIIFPAYFDVNRSVRMGRRLAKAKAIPLPSIEELAEAATKLKYSAEIDPSAKYPRSWSAPAGMLMIDTMGQKKVKVMEKLAKEILDMRIHKKAAADSSKKKKKKKKKK
ncbi:MAG: signal recognition particle subunit SRP19/SEC65 family protein [Promethearchaeota archaeon]